MKIRVFRTLVTLIVFSLLAQTLTIHANGFVRDKQAESTFSGFDSPQVLLPTTPDWVVTGTVNEEHYAFISNVGDVNGDGYDDVAIGSAPRITSSLPGRVDVFYGSSAGLSESPSWSMTGDQVGSNFGSAMRAGDVNGDGYYDLLIGASYYDDGEIDEGKVFVYLGSSAGLSHEASWSYEGEQLNANLGYLNINPSGDVNHDGYSDVLVTARGFDNGRGRVLLFLGSKNGLNNSPSWVMTGDQTESMFGNASVIGDVNGDGFLDIGVGAWQYDNGQVDEGRAYIYYGSITGIRTQPSWIVESNISGGTWGKHIAPAGDVNGDGFSDILVGSDLYGSNKGFLFLGSSNGPSTTPDWSSISYGDNLNTIGDVNLDGYSDVCVGRPWASSATGGVVIYYGSINGLSVNPNWSVTGPSTGSHFGFPCVSLGDINGDQAADIGIGAHTYPNYLRNGRAYAYYGNPSFFGYVRDDLYNPISGITVMLGDGRTVSTDDSAAITRFSKFAINFLPL